MSYPVNTCDCLKVKCVSPERLIMKIVPTYLDVCKDMTRWQCETLFSECDRSTEVKGLGVDITSIQTIARLIDRYDCQTLNLLFTPAEINCCQTASNPPQYYAICFATKEAVGKALGTGLVGIDWNEIEAKLIHNKLIIHLHGKATVLAQRCGIQKWIASWCDWNQHVMVHVLAQ